MLTLVRNTSAACSSAGETTRLSRVSSVRDPYSDTPFGACVADTCRVPHLSFMLPMTRFQWFEDPKQLTYQQRQCFQHIAED